MSELEGQLAAAQAGQQRLSEAESEIASLKAELTAQVDAASKSKEAEWQSRAEKAENELQTMTEQFKKARISETKYAFLYSCLTGTFGRFMAWKASPRTAEKT